VTEPDAEVVVVPLDEGDWPAASHIYQAGIDTGHATFETTPPTWESFDTKTLPDHRFAAVDATGQVLGWAAASPTSDRCVYAGVAEISVYVHPDARGQGIGRQLLDTLIESTEEAGIWTLQAGVFPENPASLALHEQAGFRIVGTRRNLGRMTHGPLAGRWRDVVFLERRSLRTGT
jgi:phosphinothricin acetyltransferase